MSIWDSILGPEQQNALGLGPADVRRNPAEEAVARLLPGMMQSVQVDAPHPSAERGAPFTEVIIPADSIPGPEVFTSPSIFPAYQVPIPGESLYIRKFGTPPRARYLLDIGGQIGIVAPGFRITTKFQSVSFVRRMHYCPIDVGLTGFQGQLRLIIGKNREDRFEEEESPLVAPWFRPVDIIGSFSSPFTASGGSRWQLVASNGLLSLALAGCTKIRIWIASSNWQDSTVVASTLALGDVITLNYQPTQELYQDVRAGNRLWGNSEQALLTVTWNARDVAANNIRVVEVDMAAYQENGLMLVTNSLGHSQYMMIQGVP